MRAARRRQHRRITHAGVSPVCHKPARDALITPDPEENPPRIARAARDRHSPGGAVPGSPLSSSPRPQTPPAHTGTGQGQHKDATAGRGGRSCSQLGHCELLTRILSREGSERRGRETSLGLQPQTVSKWVSICLSTQSAGRITPTAQSHHGSYPHRRRREGGRSGKRLALICQSNK